MKNLVCALFTLALATLPALSQGRWMRVENLGELGTFEEFMARVRTQEERLVVAFSKGNRLFYATTKSIIYSDSYGKSWVNPLGGTYERFTGRPSRLQPQAMYPVIDYKGDAILISCHNGLLLRSIDSGTTWTTVRLADFEELGRDTIPGVSPFQVSRSALSGHQNEVIALLGGRTIGRSTDAGLTWTRLEVPVQNYAAVILKKPELVIGSAERFPPGLWPPAWIVYNTDAPSLVPMERGWNLCQIESEGKGPDQLICHGLSGALRTWNGFDNTIGWWNGNAWIERQWPTYRVIDAYNPADSTIRLMTRRELDGQQIEAFFYTANDSSFRIIVLDVSQRGEGFSFSRSVPTLTIPELRFLTGRSYASPTTQRDVGRFADGAVFVASEGFIATYFPEGLTSIKEPTTVIAQLQVRPNPTNESAVVEASTDIKTIRLYDAQGNVIHSESFQIPVRTSLVNLAGLASGSYRAVVQTVSGQHLSTTIVKVQP